MVERGVGDERQVIELNRGQVLGRARPRPELPDSLVSDQLAVRKTDGLEERAARRQGCQRRVGDQDAFLQIDALQ